MPKNHFSVYHVFLFCCVVLCILSKLAILTIDPLSSMSVVLTGDIGGTNSRLTLTYFPTFEPLTYGSMPEGESIYEAQFFNHEYDTFENVLGTFFGMVPANQYTEFPFRSSCIKKSVIAVAGPIKQNQATLTNRQEWGAICGKKLSDDFNMGPVTIINDFVACGYGSLSLNLETNCRPLYLPSWYLKHEDSEAKEEDAPCGVIIRTTRNPFTLHQPIAVIGAGTGLGQCFLTPDHYNTFSCFASENGHANFASRSDMEMRLMKEIMRILKEEKEGIAYGESLPTTSSLDSSMLSQSIVMLDEQGEEEQEEKHQKEQEENEEEVTIENLVSGPGIAYIYLALSRMYPEQVQEGEHSRICSSGDFKGKVIGELQDQYKLCQWTMQVWAELYGSEIGNYAIRLMPSVVFVTGVISSVNLGQETEEKKEKNKLLIDSFLKGYLSKVKMHSIVEKTPVYLVTANDLGMRGSVLFAYQQLGRMKGTSLSHLHTERSEEEKEEENKEEENKEEEIKKSTNLSKNQTKYREGQTQTLNSSDSPSSLNKTVSTGCVWRSYLQGKNWPLILSISGISLLLSYLMKKYNRR